MLRVSPLLVILLAGCRSDIDRGNDLQKVVVDDHTAFIAQQITLLDRGDATEAIRQIGERARDRAKFDAFRDKAQSILQPSLKAAGRVLSYHIREAEKISSDAGPDGVILRVEVKFEHATAWLGYTFFLVDDVWKTAGLNVKFHSSSE
jgi:hypothetical protein